jgi:S1-C subfamily serine protease
MRRQTRTILLALVTLLSLARRARWQHPRVEALDRDIAQRILRSSVKLAAPFDADDNAGSLCSGTMLDQEGYILTNFHCIGYPTSGESDSELANLGLRPGDLFNAKGLSVVAITDDARKLPKPTYVAQLLSYDSDLDIAVLKIIAYYNSKQKITATLPVVSIDLADSDTVETLDDVIVVGYPGIAGDTVTATEGRISGFVDEDGDDQFDWFKTDVLVNQGNSGGSAVNAAGQLIGVPTGRIQDQLGNVIYLVRPTNRAVPYIEEARKVGASGGTISSKPPNTSSIRPSSTASFGEIVFGTSFDENDGVLGQATSFQSGISEVHAGLPYDGLRNGMDWGYMWQYEGQDITGDLELEWDFGASGILDLSLSGKKGLTDGNYNLQVYLRGDLLQEGGFTVGQRQANNRPPQKPQASGDDGVIITGIVVDHATQRPIQGAVVVFLYAGLTVDDFDADETEDKFETVLSYGVTDADGVYTIDTPLPRGESYSAIVGATGYQRIAEDFALEIAADDPELLELDPLELDRL